ncbi:hypothetical protein J4732_02045 [Serratia marcescens]|uniref:Uncharacterized protein n=1 Tax=Serratia marcescens TaxID=615 RepID=A0A939NQ22_SERMA|nr:hypothetical protein [Serratia marcescens]
MWDKANLQGKVTVDDITATAKRYVPEMRKQGADLWWRSHIPGCPASLKAMAENSVLQPNTGHRRHHVRPRPCGVPATSPTLRADIDKGLLNGVPAVMPGQWGDHLGVVDLQLNNDSGSWKGPPPKRKHGHLTTKRTRNRWRRKMPRW